MTLQTVTEGEFFAALYADKRDIMPSVEDPEKTIWRVRHTREVWGITTPGWKGSGNPNNPKTYAIYK